MLANPPPPPHTHKRTHTQCKEEKVAFEVCGATFSSQGREVVLFTKHARTAAQQEQELARSKSSKKKDAGGGAGQPQSKKAEAKSKKTGTKPRNLPSGIPKVPQLLAPGGGAQR